MTCCRVEGHDMAWLARGDLARARHIARSAATIALVVRRPEGARQQDLLMYDLGQRRRTSCWLPPTSASSTGYAAASHQEQAWRMLGFPDSYFCAYLIGLDCPADQRLRPLVRPDRRPLDDVVHWDRWHGVELVRLYSNPPDVQAQLLRVRRAASAPRPAEQVRRSRHHHRRLSQEEVGELIAAYLDHDPVHLLAQRFGIHRVTVTELMRAAGSGAAPDWAGVEGRPNGRQFVRSGLVASKVG